MTTNNLTEQWKKGELKEGYYYITNKAHSIKFNQIAYYVVYGETKYWTECEDEDVEEVLAPVPSWEEYLESESHCAVYSEVNQVLKEENQRLKSLLKDLRKLIGNNFLNHEMRILLNEIDEVLK